MTPVYSFFIINFSKVLFGEGHQTKSKHDGHQTETEYIDNSGKNCGELGDGELADDDEVNDEKNGSNNNSQDHNGVSFQWLFEFAQSCKLPRVLILLHDWQHQPAHEEINIVDDQPCQLNPLNLLWVDGGFVNVHGEDQETYEWEIERYDHQRTHVVWGRLVAEVPHQSYRE